MESVSARVFCKPAQKGNSKQIVRFGGKVRLVSSAKDKQAERELTRLLEAHAPDAPLDGPLQLRLTIHHPVPSSWPQWRTEAALQGVVLPSGNGTPDVGNVLKLVEDAMEAAGWIEDDARTVAYHLDSLYSAEPGYTVKVSTLTGRCGPKTRRADVPPLPDRHRAYYSPSDAELKAHSPTSSRPCPVS
jgi:Holliday junction resolvase RusA-like endonuclease